MSAARARLPDPGLFARGPAGRLLAALGGEGEEIRVAGGAVRDAMLGRVPTDVDCATTALPDETMRRATGAGFRTIPTGIEHGTVTVLVDETRIEVTTLRADVATDGRHATVAFGRDFAADAARRDFTINALFADRDGAVYDHVGGLADLAARRVRFIGDPARRIREDYLRILRLFRFHAAYGEGPVDPAALAACAREREGLAILSRERVRAELVKLCVAPRAGEMLRLMDEAGLLGRLVQGVAHHRRFDALLAEDDAAPPADRLAMLTVEIAEDAGRLRERLSLANEETDVAMRHAVIAGALRAAGFRPTPQMARALLYRAGAEAKPVLVARLAAAGAPASLLDVMRTLAPPPASPPWRGADALAAGIAPGPAVGALLARAEALWIAADFPADAAALEGLWDAARGG
jgi:poly(A) polymerase